jgi:predicted transglutaminase-like cysteine proteinase
MLKLRRAAALMVSGLAVFAAFGAAADTALSTAAVYPGWKTISSTNWDVEASGVRNWHEMLVRWADGKDCDSDSCSSAGWAELVAQVKAAGGVVAQLKTANALINNPARHPYKEDSTTWNAPDYFETPYEFLKRSGDTEDYAIAKYFLLKAAGVPTDDMQVVLVRLKSQGGIGHAILAVRTDDTHSFILDNRLVAIMDAKLLKSEFTPVLGLTETRWSTFLAPQ